MFSLKNLGHLTKLACEHAPAYLHLNEKSIRCDLVEVEAQGTYIYVRAQLDGNSDSLTSSGPPLLGEIEGKRAVLGSIDYFIRGGTLTIEISLNWDVDEVVPDEVLASAFVAT